jgi:hypothetical protein
MARGKKTGGRRAGTPNKATLEKALIAERAVAEVKAAGRKLATEMLDAYMHIFAETATRFRALGDLDKFALWAGHSVECAKALAPFQSPRLSAVAVGAAVIDRIEVVGGLPDGEDGSWVDVRPQAASPSSEPTAEPKPEPETVPESKAGTI